MKSVITLLAFSVLTIAGNSQTNFTVNTAINKATLTWETAEETNNKPFFVERSTDGVLFQRIGTVVSAINSTASQYVDLSPSNGNNYYRIQQIDANGKAYFTTVQKVNILTKPLEVNVYPNPIREQANLSINSSASKQIKVLMRIIDNNGRPIWQQDAYLAAGVNNTTLNTSLWPAGVYRLNISGEGVVYSNTSLMKL